MSPTCSITERSLTLDDARFDGPVTIQARCQTLDAIGIRCREGLSLATRTGIIVLNGARFDGPTTIAASRDSIDFPPPMTDDGEQRYKQDDWEQGGPPRLRNVEATDLSNVTVAGLDLTECAFTGAYNLDKLHIDGPPNFATPPTGWWSRRMTLAEECYWRARYDRRPNGWQEQHVGWYGWVPDHNRRASRDVPSREHAERVQAAYRELRKSLEDAKDDPGAADFYYGEMEMRRVATRAAPRPSEAPNRFENALLTAYWAVSGYGLRASRAFSALLLVLALATVGFATVGFARAHDTVYVPAVSSTTANQPVPYKQSSVTTDKPGIRDAAYYSVESATSLLREPTTEPLTTSGRIFEITLRLLGPLLLGLALLALRGRVKR